MGLVINQEKMVYMYSGKYATWHQEFAIGNYVNLMRIGPCIILIFE